MSGPVSRTVSIYIDQSAAQEQADKLTKKVEQLTNTIRRGEAAGRDMSTQIANLGQAQSALNQTNEIIAGRMTPSMRQLEQQATRLRNTLANMSRDAPGFQDNLNQYRQVNQALETMQRDLRGVANAMNTTPKPGLWDQIKQGFGVGAGFSIGVMAIQKGVSWIKDFAVGAADAAANMESLKVSYTTLLGSGKAANDFIKDLQKFAAATPFQFNEVAEMSKQLLAFGFSQKEIIPTLDMLGNIASAVGKEKLPNLILAFSQVRSNGKLMAQDLNQLINAGFNPLLVIQEKTGRSMSDLRKDMEKGLITFDMVQNAFKSVTSEGGRFYNLMQDQSKTTSGALSNLQDNWEQFQASLGASTNGVLNSLYIVLGKIVNTFKDWVTLSPAEELEKEREQFDALIISLVESNKRGRDRSDIIAQINKQYPDLINNIDLEKASNNQLLIMLDSVNRAYEDKIRLAGASVNAEKDEQNAIQASANVAEQKLALIKGLRKANIDIPDLNNLTQEQGNSLVNQLSKHEKGFLGFGTESEIDDAISAAQILPKYIEIARQQSMAAKESATYAAEEKDYASDENITRRQIDKLQKQNTELLNGGGLIGSGVENAATTVADNNKEIARLKKELAESEKAKLDDTKAKPTSKAPLTAAEKKAASQHAQAVKDVEDLQFKLKQLQEDIKAAQIDADAGFEAKAAQQIQAVVDKYDKLMKQVSDRISKAAGLTKKEKDDLNKLLTDLGSAESQELNILQKNQFKDRNEAEYTKALKSLSDYYQQQRQLAGEAYNNGTISYKEYQDKLVSLDAEEAQSRVTVAQDYADNVKAAANDLETAKTKALEKGIKDRRTIEEKGLQDKLARDKVAAIKATPNSKDELDAKKKIIQDQFDIETAGMDKTSDMYKEKEAERDKAIAELNMAYLIKKIQDTLSYIKAAEPVFDNFMNYLNAGDQNQLQAEKDSNDAKKTSYQKMLDNKQITQQQYDKFVADTDANSEKKQKDIQSRIAKRNKAMAIFNATIATAQAVAGQLSMFPVGPWNIALAAAMGVAGALQIATILKTKDTFAKGGIFNKKGGIAKGASHTDGGISMINADGQKVGEMEGDEAYMILSKKTTANNRPIIEKLLASSMSGDGRKITPDWVFDPPQQINYADAIETMNFTRHYKNGGITTNNVPVVKNAPTGTTSSDQKTLTDLTKVVAQLNENLKQPLKAVVVWTELQRTQKQYDLLQKQSSLNING